MILKDYICSTLLTAGIVVLSTMPIPENAPLGDVPLIDKWVHMVMYAGLAFIIWFDHVVRNRKAINWRHYLFIFLYATLLGGLMELVQAYLTTCRSGDWIDFEADAIGAIIGIVLSILANKIWKEKISVRS